MATKITGTQFFTELDSLTNNKFSGVADGRKLRYLNRALINRNLEMKSHVEEAYGATETLTFASDSYEIDLPTDMDKTTTASFLLWYDVARTAGVSSDMFRVEAGKLRFDFEQTIGEFYQIEYTKEPNRYTAIGDTILETASIRALEILQTEVESIFESDRYQGQISATAQSAILKSNQIS